MYPFGALIVFLDRKNGFPSSQMETSIEPPNGEPCPLPSPLSAHVGLPLTVRIAAAPPHSLLLPHRGQETLAFPFQNKEIIRLPSLLSSMQS